MAMPSIEQVRRITPHPQTLSETIAGKRDAADGQAVAEPPGIGIADTEQVADADHTS